ncbi:hypothetical protein C8J56DRAFT_1052474 [Mycena floridula]|nr:hypothetical protein C8J56DRAFT_1052474 [Mycena floridula]
MQLFIKFIAISLPLGLVCARPITCVMSKLKSKDKDKVSSAPRASIGAINFCDHFPENFSDEYWNEPGCSVVPIDTPGLCHVFPEAGSVNSLKAVSRTHKVECRFFVNSDCTGDDTLQTEVAFSTVTTHANSIKGNSWRAWQCVEAKDDRKDIKDNLIKTLKANPWQTAKSTAKVGYILAKNLKINQPRKTKK